jgi:hypothetical protein
VSTSSMRDLQRLRHRVALAVDAVLSVRPPPTDKLRARKVVSRSKGRSTGKFPSRKVGRMMQWESPAEHDAMKVIEADPRYLTYAEQPVVIRYRMDGCVRRHYPDLEVRWRGGRELQEIKTDQEAQDPEVQRRSALMARDLPLHGYGYRLVRRSELLAGPQLRNADLLLKHGRQAVPMLERELLRRLFAARGGLTWGELAAGAHGPSALRHVSRLVLEGQVDFDRSQPIQPGTTLHWVARASKE